MTAKLSTLSTLATQLNKSTAQINAKIRETGDALEEMNIGLEVWLRFPYLREDEYVTPEADAETDAALSDEHLPLGTTIRSFDADQLGFAKTEDKWQLAARTVTVEEFNSPTDGQEDSRVTNPTNLMPLLKAPRAVRLASLPLLEKLTDEIAERMSESLKIANSAQAKDKMPEGGIDVRDLALELQQLGKEHGEAVLVMSLVFGMLTEGDDRVESVLIRHDEPKLDEVIADAHDGDDVGESFAGCAYGFLVRKPGGKYEGIPLGEANRLSALTEEILADLCWKLNHSYHPIYVTKLTDIPEDLFALKALPEPATGTKPQ